MKVEKINENKVRITLTLEELEKRKISLKDIEKNNEIAKNLFMDLIEETNLDEDFALEDSQLLIEASSDNNNLFIVTITKVDTIPELKQYSLLDKNSKRGYKKTKNPSKNVIEYKVDSYIYSFEDLDKILDLCQIAKQEQLFFGKNSLYKYNNKYYIIFANSSVKNKKFLKTFVFLSEFCQDYYSYNMLSVAIKEKATVIIENNALQKLSKI